MSKNPINQRKQKKKTLNKAAKKQRNLYFPSDWNSPCSKMHSLLFVLLLCALQTRCSLYHVMKTSIRSPLSFLLRAYKLSHSASKYAKMSADICVLLPPRIKWWIRWAGLEQAWTLCTLLPSWTHCEGGLQGGKTVRTATIERQCDKVSKANYHFEW